MRGLLDPKMDFVFKNIFGSEKHPNILISFLNATLKPKDLITEVDIKNTDLNKGYIEDKFSRLDVKATTSNNEIINIEIQLKNEYNMIKRSLYYWSKLYSEQLNEGEDYSLLKRTICINILNFKYLKTRMFHSVYRMKEIHTNEELSNIQEIHFIEIPKLEDGSDEKDMLVAWIEFLKNPESEKVRSLEMSVDEIREAKDELIKMSNDDTQRELYEMRAKTLRDKISALNEAERKGIQKGRAEGRKEGIEEGEKNKAIEIAKSLINLGLDKESIAKSTGLDLLELEKLMN
ncbi:Rpn family recombination-promoting nuclease/putative transposase [Intestinibacter bartlettii]|uniref:Rpn family recombination-promoting nuclease/putative transposase n=1 Tax=Intestinibacter bartlettii TaxID=261299 RepID=A0ABS6DY73_9FIRM|nr:Rpn family recombination-promoting nuclease/putative transposase [Intestinibacter bartlettii]MBU5336774.1 Rpn family recombination-promoting nuclease/putative transposase [Intestinibacter bartlettii]